MPAEQISSVPRPLFFVWSGHETTQLGEADLSFFVMQALWTSEGEVMYSNCPSPVTVKVHIALCGGRSWNAIWQLGMRLGKGNKTR